VALNARELFTDSAPFGRIPGDVPEAVRQRAETLLRYYPEIADIEIAYNNCGHWFGPPEN
jgi:hypothetical protein